MAAKKSCHSFGKTFNAPERSYSVLLKNDMFNKLWSYRSRDIQGRNIRKTAESAKSNQILYFQGFTFC